MILQQLFQILVSPETKNYALSMFSGGFQNNGFSDRLPLDSHDFTLRLFKPTPDFVNFEFLVSSKTGRYFKPIALFRRNGDINLFEQLRDAYDSTKENLNTNTIKFLNTQNNAVISAFSKEAYESAIEVLAAFKNDPQKPFTLGGLTKYDREIYVNGMDCELIFCNQHYPQFFMDDKYGISGHIGAYIPTEQGINVAPAAAHKQTFDNMRNLGLLTAFSSL